MTINNTDEVIHGPEETIQKNKISQINLRIEIDECRAIACFLSESISLLLEEYSNFTEKCPIPQGASGCLDLLSNKLLQISEQI